MPVCQQQAKVKLAKETLKLKANFVADSQLQNNNCEWFQKPASATINLIRDSAPLTGNISKEILSNKIKMT